MMNRWFSVICLAAAAFTAQGALIHHYEFTSAVTDSAGTDNGTLQSGASVSGGLLILDGVNDFVDFAVNLVPTLGSRTVAMYARQLSPQAGVFMELISQGTGGSAFYIGHDTVHNFRVGDGWTSTGVAFPNDGQRHHYAVVYDEVASQTRLYVDGGLAASTVFLNAGGGGTPTRFGRQYGPHSEFFHGELDDVRIYDSALTQSELAALTGVPEPSTIGLMLAGALVLGLRRRRA